MSTILLLLLATSDLSVTQLEANARRATAGVAQCPATPAADEVVVCGRRRSDRYRLPLAARSGAAGVDRTPDERTALLTSANNCREKRAFLVGCGAVGAGVGIGFGPHARNRLLTPGDAARIRSKRR